MKKSLSKSICCAVCFLAVFLVACTPTEKRNVGRVAENTGDVLRPAVDAINNSGQTTGRLVENAGDVVRPAVNSPQPKEKEKDDTER